MNLAKTLLYNLAYVNLSIGTPSQIIPFQLNINSQSFYVSKEYFYSNLSSTYELTSNNEISYYINELYKGFNSKDILRINNIEKKIDFSFGTEIQKENSLGGIGLLIPKEFKKDCYPFFTSLKKAGIINSYTFTLKYFSNISIKDLIYNYEKENKIIGEFIIGDEPHNYETNKSIYNESEYIKINALYQLDGLYWDIKFDSIYIQLKDNQIDQSENHESKIKVVGYNFAEINPDIGFILAPRDYLNSLKKFFFNNYKDICKERTLPNEFIYFECDKNDSFSMISLPDLYFEHINLETTFNLTYEDLFILDEANNKYIFLVFNRRGVSNWVFGTVFLRKYQLTFNVDSKNFGFYKSINKYSNRNEKEKENKDNTDDKNNKGEDKEKDNKDIPDDNKNNTNKTNEDNSNINNEKNKNNDNKNTNENSKTENKNNNSNNQSMMYIIIGILFLVFSVLFIFFGMFIQKKCNNKRRKRINELEDVDNNEYNYIDKNNNFLNKKNINENNKNNEDEENPYKIN